MVGPLFTRFSTSQWHKLGANFFSIAALTLLSSAVCLAQDITLNETGSTLLYPLLTTWVTHYTTSHSAVHIKTGATGSEAGIQQVEAGKVEIGASDAYMSDAQIAFPA